MSDNNAFVQALWRPGFGKTTPQTITLGSPAPTDRRVMVPTWEAVGPSEWTSTPDTKNYRIVLAPIRGSELFTRV